ncbi:unnamed protein product [Linum trigynum]|uniref:Uncharacterized protein n=1 Tax=Linum trigynum TaxID=586398 RepID=A0AAV2FD29_9ROSI
MFPARLRKCFPLALNPIPHCVFGLSHNRFGRVILIRVGQDEITTTGLTLSNLRRRDSLSRLVIISLLLAILNRRCHCRSSGSCLVRRRDPISSIGLKSFPHHMGREASTSDASIFLRLCFENPLPNLIRGDLLTGK